MKIVIVTGDRPHCVYLCKELSKKYDVAAVFHYKGDHQFALSAEQEKAKKDKLSERYSEDFVNSHYDAFLSDKKLPLELQHGYEEADEYFKDAMDYGDLSKDRIFYEDDINSIESIEKIAAYNPDVVVCHGGPLYTKEFIDAFKLVLNYHSGISPVYNGSDSHMFAFANGHPHLSGGTLMVMNPKIDGGDILAHYLPEIEDGDWPGRLFTKGLFGTVKLYDEFLDNLRNGGQFSKASQPVNPLFYYKRIQWGEGHLMQLQYHLKENVSSKHARAESIVNYWKSTSDEEAKAMLDNQLLSMLFHGEKSTSSNVYFLKVSDM